MSNLWNEERKLMYEELLEEYLEEGYDIKEAKKFARKETNEHMKDRMSLVEDILDNGEA